MKKAATIMLWISIIARMLYLVVSLGISVLLGALPIYGNASASAMEYTIVTIECLVNGVIPLVIQLMMTFVILFSMKGYSEKIIAEIATIIMFSGIFSPIMWIVHTFIFQIMARVGSQELATYSAMSNGSTYASILSSLSLVLLMLGIGFSIAYKKVEMVDIRRIQQENENNDLTFN